MTFIFPKYQGKGLGIKTHSLLLSKGTKIWEEKYNDKIYGFDTLDNRPNSRLFLNNGWEMVGKTKGYSSDSNCIFSKRADKKGWNYIKNNKGLKKNDGNVRWWIYVKKFNIF